MSDQLEHHGVKGMKWGVRKERTLRDKAARTHFKGRARRLTAKADNILAERTDKVNRQVKREARRVGDLRGTAKYITSTANKKARNYQDAANALNETAKAQEAKGNSMRALAARKSAQSLSYKAKEIRSEAREDASYYLKRANAHQQKISETKSAKATTVGNKQLNKIINTRSDQQVKYLKDVAKQERKERINNAVNSLTR